MPRFSYGIAFTNEEAIAFARKHKLFQEGPGDEDGYWHVVRTVDHIVWRTRLTGAKLARPQSNKYRWMIELYTNENMYEVPYSRKAKKERVGEPWTRTTTITWCVAQRRALPKTGPEV